MGNLHNHRTATTADPTPSAPRRVVIFGPRANVLRFKMPDGGCAVVTFSCDGRDCRTALRELLAADPPEEGGAS